MHDTYVGVAESEYSSCSNVQHAVASFSHHCSCIQSSGAVEELMVTSVGRSYGGLRGGPCGTYHAISSQPCRLQVILDQRPQAINHFRGCSGALVCSVS